MEPGPPALEAQCLSRWTTRQVPDVCFSTIWFWLDNKSASHSVVSLCYPMDYSPPGSSVHGILQARILESVAIPFSRGSSWPRDWTWLGLLHCRQILYCLSHQGSLILTWGRKNISKQLQIILVVVVWIGFFKRYSHVLSPPLTCKCDLFLKNEFCICN